MEDGDRFCAVCGEPVKEDEAILPQAVSESTPSQMTPFWNEPEEEPEKQTEGASNREKEQLAPSEQIAPEPVVEETQQQDVSELPVDTRPDVSGSDAPPVDETSRKSPPAKKGMDPSAPVGENQNVVKRVKDASETMGDTEGTLAIKIFCGISGAVLMICGLGSVFSGLSLIIQGFAYGGILNYLLEGVFKGAIGVAYIITALVLFLFVLCKTKTYTEVLFGSLCSASALTAGALVIQRVFAILGILYGDSILWPIMGYAVVLLGVYSILCTQGNMPFGGHIQTETIVAAVQQLPDVAQDILNQYSGKAKATMKVNQAQGTPQQRTSAEQHTQTPGNASANSNPAVFLLKTNRGIIVYLLLSVVTCGIYALYFLYSLARDINIACEGDGQHTPGLLPFMLLTLVTCGLYAYYWYYKLANRLQQNAPRYGLCFTENGTTVLLWMLVGILLCGLGPLFALHIVFRNANVLCNAYNQKNVNR